MLKKVAIFLWKKVQLALMAKPAESALLTTQQRKIF